MMGFLRADLVYPLINKMDEEISNMVTTLIILVVSLSLANLMIVSVLAVLFTRMDCLHTRNPVHCLEWMIKKIQSLCRRNNNNRRNHNTKREDKNNKIYDDVNT